MTLDMPSGICVQHAASSKADFRAALVCDAVLDHPERDHSKPCPGASLAVVLAKTAKPIAEREVGVKDGKPGPGRGNRTADDVSRFGNSADYLTRRIARDRPDILERMKAGEFPSVRAAAIEAGIVKQAETNLCRTNPSSPAASSPSDPPSR